MEHQAAYQDALRYLYDRLPMFSKLGKDAIKKDLTNTLKLCAALNDPQEAFRSIHIAGTNGKGSTSHMLAAVLQDAGYKVGLYTSPHLADFRERIRINGVPVSKSWVTSFVDTNKNLIEEVAPSFFEITVAMAFKYFAEEQADVAVIETGLGGRLDSTNIITPILSIITNISYDHKDVLGDTLQQIAFEKAGIIKQNVPVLIGEQQDETAGVFFETAVHKQSTVYYAQSLWDLVRVKQDAHFQYFKAIHKAQREMYDLRTDLLGDYQTHNIKTVLSAIDILRSSYGFDIQQDRALATFSSVKKLTGLRGRWECLGQHPLIITDVAHNPAGVGEVMKQWQLIPAKTKHIVTGFVKDKDVREALALYPKDAVYHFCHADIPRALPASELQHIAAEVGLEGMVYSSVAEAVAGAVKAMSEQDALLITGSFFIVGEAMAYFEAEKAGTAAVK